MAYHGVGNEHTRLFASGPCVAGLIHHLRRETLISLSRLTILTTAGYCLPFLTFTLNCQHTSGIYYTSTCFLFLHFTVTAMQGSPQKVSNLDYWEIVVKCTCSHKMFDSVSSLIIDLGRHQAGCGISRGKIIYSRAFLLFSLKNRKIFHIQLRISRHISS